jgi:hypothetical protein
MIFERGGRGGEALTLSSRKAGLGQPTTLGGIITSGAVARERPPVTVGGIRLILAESRHLEGTRSLRDQG